MAGPSRDYLINVSIGGTSYFLPKERVLSRDDHSLLAEFIMADHLTRLKIADTYFDDTHEYYFERNSLVAQCIFEYYMTGMYPYYYWIQTFLLPSLPFLIVNLMSMQFFNRVSRKPCFHQNAFGCFLV